MRFGFRLFVVLSEASSADLGVNSTELGVGIHLGNKAGIVGHSIALETHWFLYSKVLIGEKW